MKNYFAERISLTRKFVPFIAPADAARLLGQSDVLFLDVRDECEIEETGKIKGALNVLPELLEFATDPKSISHMFELAPEKIIIVYSAADDRSALAGAALKQLGFADVRNMGAFEVWKRGGGAVEY
jgi:rhodanese-related sulfurtransferase